MRRAIRTTAFAALLALSGCVVDANYVVRDDAAPAPASSVPADWPRPYADILDPAFDPAGIASLEARMEQFVSDGDVRGIATLLVHDGKVVSHVRAGIRREADSAPVQDDTLFRIYSMSKPITGVAMMILLEEGAFSLDDPVTNFLPELENLQVYSADGPPVPVSRPATMRELMSHTAGFAYGLSDVTPPDAQIRASQLLYSPDLDSFVSEIAKVPLLSQPGTDWYYSVSVDLQGAIIERISGQSFPDFLQNRLFTPLGMDDTGFFVPDAEYDRMSDVWGFDPETGDQVPLPYPFLKFAEGTPVMPSGGGGLVSTLDDYARFCQMLLDDGALGDVRILSPGSVALMTTNGLRDDQSIFSDGSMGLEMAGMGFGLNVGTFDGPPATDRGYGPGTHYWGGAAGTWYWIDPEHDLFFIGMIQRFRAGGPPVDFRAISADGVYSALEDDA